MPGPPIPDNRLHEIELSQRAFELDPCGISWPKRDSRVVWCGVQFVDGDFLDEHEENREGGDGMKEEMK